MAFQISRFGAFFVFFTKKRVDERPPFSHLIEIWYLVTSITAEK